MVESEVVFFSYFHSSFFLFLTPTGGSNPALFNLTMLEKPATLNSSHYHWTTIYYFYIIKSEEFISILLPSLSYLDIFGFYLHHLSILLYVYFDLDQDEDSPSVAATPEPSEDSHGKIMDEISEEVPEKVSFFW